MKPLSIVGVRFNGVILALSALSACAGLLRAEDQISVPSPVATASAAAPGEAASVPAPDEAAKAPSASKPAAKPQFTLPEVVITGDNQLTIGAKRLEHPEEDVTRGSQELRGLPRGDNDLPGLENQHTGLSALSPEAARDTVAVLHGGAGNLGDWEGWGLLGHQGERFQALLSAMKESFGGVSLPEGSTASRSDGWGVVLQAEPSDRVSVRFSRDYEDLRDQTPYQYAEEDRHRTAVEGDLSWRFGPGWKANLKVLDWDSQVDSALPGTPLYDVQEREGRARVEWETRGSFLSGLWGEMGGRNNDGDFATGDLSRYDACWGRAGLRMGREGKLFLDLSLGATRFGDLGLAARGEPQAELEYRPGESTRIRVHYKSERTLPTFYDLKGSAAYVLPEGGLPVPGFIRGETGADLDRRLSEKLTLTVGGRAWDEELHPQWTESDILYRPVLENIPLIRAWEGRGGLRSEFGGGWSLQAEVKWSGAKNLDGDTRQITGWPRRTGSLGLSHKGAQHEWTLTVKGAAEREADSAGGEALPPYWTVSLYGRRTLVKGLSLWVKGDNLNGQHYELVAGYPEPRFFARAGLELVF